MYLAKNAVPISAISEDTFDIIDVQNDCFKNKIIYILSIFEQIFCILKFFFANFKEFIFNF
jgi:hypothetical protein